MPPSIQPINNKKVIKGDNVTVMCKVSGMPPPMVSWMKPNGQRQSGYMLKLVTISRNEAGEYKCEASNECGNATEMATIDVQCKFVYVECIYCRSFKLEILTGVPVHERIQNPTMFHQNLK